MNLPATRWRRRDCLHALAALPVAGGLGLRPARADEGPGPPKPAPWTPRLARQALALLASAHEHGLDPAAYGAERLAREFAAANADPVQTAALFASLHSAFERYLNHLAFGRIDPQRLHHRFSVAPRAGFDPALALAAALDAGRLDDAVNAALPPLSIYRELQKAMAGLRALGDHPAWVTRLPALPVARGSRAGKLEPGQAWAGLPMLAQRLAALEDLEDLAVGPFTETGSGERLQGPLLQALRAFQRRHGLVDDGVIGATTLAALEVSPAARARQIALSLERLRWTPLMHGPRMVVVNIPEYVLRAYEVIDGRIRLGLSMRVIVGKAMDHETPLFDERMRSIEFSPYWNVPPSIARAETVPRLRRNPANWHQQGFEFVARDGSVDTVLSGEKLDAVLAGRLRIRQRPGPANALGDVKFVFPNQDHIFLHHTPSVGLFARERRDFSHGCIRVEDPVALARFVMDGMPGWDESRIRSQMIAGVSTHVALQRPLPVVIAYGTVLVKGGRTHFLPDIYGHDARLQAAIDAQQNRFREAPR